MNKRTRVKVTENPEVVITKEVLSSSIREMSRGMKKLLTGGITRRAIVLLTHDAVKQPGPGRAQIGRGDVSAVFEAIEDLERRYCR